MRYLLKQFWEIRAERGLREAWRVLVWNARWEVGYKVGGFTRASRSSR